MRVSRGVRWTMSATAAGLIMLGTTVASASVPAARSSFATQARSDGLTVAQVRNLQREVNAFIARYGGKQVAINKVTFPGGNIVFPAPRVDTTSCPLTAFCAWPGPNYTGARRAFYACGIDYPNPYAGYEAGSWKNDQTPQDGSGPRVKMLFSDHSVEYTTAPPWCANSDFSWSLIFYFRVC